jgi:Xaa-Pro aminopeptidase
MALHFETSEYEARQKRTLARLADDGLDGLLMFRQESMYYLTGYDTQGFVYFQCLVLTGDGRFVLLTRAPDLRQARHTSTIQDIRIWVDREGADPAAELKALLADMGLEGKRLGIELESYGLTGRSWERVRTTLDGFCELVDASDLVNRLRVVKSPAELAYMRKSAELGDRAHAAARDVAGPGVTEGDILAAMQGAVFQGGGDYPASHWVLGSGENALLCRYYTGRRTLADRDQLMLEFASAYRHYHTAQMCTILIGEPEPEHVAMHGACREALAACEATLKPGARMGDVFDAHARVMDDHGYRDHRLNACGYSMGSTYPPNWMDWPMFFHGNSVEITPNMTFFLHMILMDSDSGRAMALGESVVVTDSSCEPLNKAPLDLCLR